MAVFTPTTLTLYVDGAQVATASSGISDSTTPATGPSDSTHESGTWADQATNQEWTGSLADVAVIPSAISSATDTTLYGEASQSALATELLVAFPQRVLAAEQPRQRADAMPAASSSPSRTPTTGPRPA